MSLEDQLKKLFPDHVPQKQEGETSPIDRPVQKTPVRCKYEKRKGKPVTLLEGFESDNSDIKALAKELKTFLGVGGSAKAGQILIQGDYREQIMVRLTEMGFKVKRVGG